VEQGRGSLKDEFLVVWVICRNGGRGLLWVGVKWVLRVKGQKWKISFKPAFEMLF
jgi:hypothetical protein